MHYVDQAHAKSDWSAVRRIAVDETSTRREQRKNLCRQYTKLGRKQLRDALL
jgi:hypothetical protein